MSERLLFPGFHEEPLVKPVKSADRVANDNTHRRGTDQNLKGGTQNQINSEITREELLKGLDHPEAQLGQNIDMKG